MLINLPKDRQLRAEPKVEPRKVGFRAVDCYANQPLSYRAR